MDEVMERTENPVANVEDLESSISLANNVLMKHYLSNLKKYEIVPIKECLLEEDLNDSQSKYVRLFRIKSIAYDKEEDNLSKLSNVYNALSGTKCSLVLIIDSNGEKVDFYMGVKTFENEDLRVAQTTLEKTLLGNFPGCEIERVNNSKINRLMGQVFETKDDLSYEENRVITSVSGISSVKKIENEGKKKEYTQGMEKLVDSMRGEVYTSIIIADPIESEQVAEIRADYEKIYTALKPFESMDITLGTNESNAQTVTKGVSDAVSRSVTNSVGNTHSTSTSYSKTSGFSFLGFSRSKTTTTTSSDSETKSRATTNGTTKTINNSLADTATTGTSKSIQLKTEERVVKSILEKIDLQLKRFGENGDIGMWNCAAYFIADETQVSNTAAMAYYALMKGENSGLEHTAINTWNYDEDQSPEYWGNYQYKNIKEYLQRLSHPLFVMDAQVENLPIVSPASVITTKELTVQAGIPQKSVSGLQVAEFASFAREVFSYEEKGKKSIELGNIMHVGKEESTIVNLDVNSLCSHVFVTGSTGAGKSNAIYSMLENLIKCPADGTDKNVKFLVVEPAKGEYKNKFGHYDGVSVYGTNPKKTKLLRINPFSFPEDIHVLEHIDKLVEIFNVCWPMYAAMPAVLKESIERAYINAGWDLQNSENKYYEIWEKNIYPCFKDVLEEINNVLENSMYSDESKGDYKGALQTRVKSLTNGIYGCVFSTDELSNEELFDENVIVDLSRVGSIETKSLIMGLLVMKMQEYRSSSKIKSNSGLRHVTVLEEAHNLLKRTSTEQSTEGSNLLGKSVEMLANSIAEMRTYGEGFIIADQSPGLLDLSVVRNTNTKIVLRLPDASDRELVGKAIALDEEQIVELAKLRKGVAAVCQNDWLKAVLCHVDKCSDDEKEYESSDDVSVTVDESAIVRLLLSEGDSNFADKKILSDVYKMNCKTRIKLKIYKLLKGEIKGIDDFSDVFYEILNAENALDVCKGYIGEVDRWKEEMTSILPFVDELSEKEQDYILCCLLVECDNRNVIDEDMKDFVVDFVQRLPM